MSAGIDSRRAGPETDCEQVHLEVYHLGHKLLIDKCEICVNVELDVTVLSLYVGENIPETGMHGRLTTATKLYLMRATHLDQVIDQIRDNIKR